MNKLEQLEPSLVFQYFEALTRIPHGSGNVKAISDYCVSFAKEHQLEVYQDELFNVIIIKEASDGYNCDHSLILQGHLDMVCEKNADNPIDMSTQPLDIDIDGDWIHANGTTLGGDDGIAIAYALAILADDSIAHPRLEVVFTTEEETGMDGAAFLDTSILKAKAMINIDSDEEGYLWTSCAGGNKTTITMPISYEDKQGRQATIRISGLLGGHSGTEIDKGRANANILLGRVLNILKENDIGIAKIEGGLKDNAIPRDAASVLVINDDDETSDKIVHQVRQIAAEIKQEYLMTDPDIIVECILGDQVNESVLTYDSMNRFSGFLFLVPDGIANMSFHIKDLVETSSNLGVLSLANDTAVFGFSVRSSRQSRKRLLTAKIKSLAELFQGTANIVGEYPAWEYKEDSKLRQLCMDKYKELTGKNMIVNAIHAGLECGLFSNKMGSSLDIISIGPDILDIHTPEERLSISSTQRTYKLLTSILRDFAAYH